MIGVRTTSHKYQVKLESDHKAESKNPTFQNAKRGAPTRRPVRQPVRSPRRRKHSGPQSPRVKATKADTIQNYWNMRLSNSGVKSWSRDVAPKRSFKSLGGNARY